MTTEVLAKILEAQHKVSTDAGISNPWITVAEIAKEVLNDYSNRFKTNYPPGVRTSDVPKTNTVDTLRGGIGYEQD
jgi:hypothetical protein